MKAPDVIYLHKIRDEESSGYYIQWFYSRARLVPSEEYIRKDALLEWAKEMKEQVSIGLNEYDMGEENGKAEMLNKLIEIIQSL